jgi:hypothetical protein
MAPVFRKGTGDDEEPQDSVLKVYFRNISLCENLS